MLNGADPRTVSATDHGSYAFEAEGLELRVLSGREASFGIPLASPQQLGWELRGAEAPGTPPAPQGSSDMVFADAQPHALFLATGPDGAAWVEVRGFADNGSYLARFSPTRTSFSIYPLFLADHDAFVGSAAGIAIDGLQGAWVMGAAERRVVRIAPFGEIERFDLPKQALLKERISATGQLAADPHGRIWFVQSTSGQIGFLERGKGTFCVANLPGANQIAVADGRIAVLNPDNGKVLLVTTDARAVPCH